jgi:hypothetical protein
MKNDVTEGVCTTLRSTTHLKVTFFNYITTMISSIAWVPKGVANPHPQKYELSATERELLESLSPEEDNSLERRNFTFNAKPKTRPLPHIENELPADLRMNEYSSDDDSMTNEVAMGRLLVGHDEEMQHAEEEDAEKDEFDEREDEIAPEKDVEHDDSDDDLADVPDTREFEPINLAAMQAMGISHVGGGGVMNGSAFLADQDDEDNSEAEDVALTPDDALVVVAKTEDVSFLNELHSVFNPAFSTLFFC